MDGNTKTPAVVILVATVLGIGYCLWKITQSPTANEALLLSLFMTLLSILASWIISRYYAKASYEDNLKIFAFKAAEKVTNLSNELDRLSTFLQKALDEDDFNSPNDELLAKTIRFEDAIHLITALKSVNDTSLSDWKGIIGDELLAQREATRKNQEEREERLSSIMEKMMHIEQESTEASGIQEREERDRLRSELSAIRGDIKGLAFQVGGVPLRISQKRKVVEKSCPRCGQLIQFQQGKGIATKKKVECPKCNARLYSQFDGLEIHLKERNPLPETLVCPSCNHVQEVNLDPLPGTMLEYECVKCQVPLRAVRSKREVQVRIRTGGISFSKPDDIDFLHLPTTVVPEVLLESVATEMGPQPWAVGKSHEVRLKLALNRSTIDFAIRQLIAKGVFMPQINGILYTPTSGSTIVSK